jgi:hypothetical protein
MTDDQLGSILTDLTEIHYPGGKMTTAQLGELKRRLRPYQERVAIDAIKDYARTHEFLNPEALMAAVAATAESRDVQTTLDRRREDDDLRAEIAAEAERIDTAIASLSLEEFAELLEEVRLEEGDRFTPRMYARGRGDKAMRGLVYQRMKRAAYQRARQPQPIGGR